jgi:type III secretory pathway component EscT
MRRNALVQGSPRCDDNACDEFGLELRAGGGYHLGVPSSVSSPDLLPLLLAELGRWGLDPEGWLRGVARLIPTVLLVPAFGLRALPFPAQLLFAFILAASTLPLASTSQPLHGPWLLALLGEVARGLPVAVSAAATIWAATMAGNLLDELRGAHHPGEFPLVDSASGPFGVLLSLAASISFLELGGPARLAEALATGAPVDSVNVWQLVRGAIGGIQLAVLIAAPLLVVLLVIEVFHALIARVTSPGLWLSLLAPLRALSFLAIAALLLDRLVEGLALWMHSTLQAS